MPRTDGKIIARWQTRLDERVACTPLEFFEMVETAVTEQNLPDIHISNVARREGGWFSPNRVYLRVRRGRLFFDISAFVVGNSLVVGWWLHEDSPGVSDLFAEIPGIGFLMERTSRADSYYTVDLIEHFQRAVHDTILQVVDELSEGNGLEHLPDAARQPVWEEIW